MASFNLTNFDAAMKHMYPYKKVENLVYKNNPAFAMIPKNTSFPGRNATYAVEYGLTTGRSASFATAQNNRGGTKIEDFVVTRVKDYSIVSVDNETLLAADGNEGSLLDVAKAKTDSALHALARTMGRDIYRSGTGSIGQIHASPSLGNTSIELVAGHAINFEVGMRLKASATDGSALYSGVLEVTAVDRDNDVLTTSIAGTTAIPSLSADDFLYVEGDAANGGSNIKLAGLDAWLPATVTSDSFFGVDRTLDSTRLGGQRESFSSSMMDTIIKAGVKVAREGGRPDALFMNPTDWAELALDLEGRAAVAGANHRRRYGAGEDSASFGFSSLSVATPTGMVECYADHNCPINVAYLLQLDTWEFKSLGSAPRMLDMDGLTGIRQANEDGVEYRWGYYGNLLCKAPGYNCRIALA
tara:strand:- start:2284 stop:3525 length:1242 start_codon:yes stop_codon:yes gene_type:complete